MIFVDEVAQSSETIVYGQQRGSCAAYLVYSDRHYQLVQPKPGQDLPSWVRELKDSQDLALFQRGGGKSAPSLKSDSWAPSAYASSVATEVWAPSPYASTVRSVQPLRRVARSLRRLLARQSARLLRVVLLPLVPSATTPRSCTLGLAPTVGGARIARRLGRSRLRYRDNASSSTPSKAVAGPGMFALGAKLSMAIAAYLGVVSAMLLCLGWPPWWWSVGCFLFKVFLYQKWDYPGGGETDHGARTARRSGMRAKAKKRLAAKIHIWGPVAHRKRKARPVGGKAFRRSVIQRCLGWAAHWKAGRRLATCRPRRRWLQRGLRAGTSEAMLWLLRHGAFWRPIGAVSTEPGAAGTGLP